MHPRARSVLVVAAVVLVLAAPVAGLAPAAAAAGDAAETLGPGDDGATSGDAPMGVDAQEDDDGERNATSDEPGPDVGSANVTVLQTPEVVGQPLVVEATTTNEGTEAGRKVVQFEVEHEIVDRAVFVLQPNETKTVTFRHVFETPGNKTFEVDSGVNRFVTVEERRPELSVSSVRVEPASVEAGGDVTVTALVRNTGYANGSLPVALELFGEVAGVKNVTLATGESAEVTFTRSVHTPGSYEATVANASAEFRVTGAESTASARTTDSVLESASETPGFGPVVALAAMLAAALLIVGRRA
ncbi:CARDB domain-containing protein [Halobacterium jilantaiense]|uniref:PGF-CTERM protein n=1 Tax=Halobacterium jilantaiense TaxID=355548 RepID=A0A1I0MRN2_9EURY|nr:CARDB domain-containing protein [Halobacterium jilantaiense]SEV90784.1 PGF-CTERM protein [Halobacterium jilantaiense]